MSWALLKGSTYEVECKYARWRAKSSALYVVLGMSWLWLVGKRRSDTLLADHQSLIASGLPFTYRAYAHLLSLELPELVNRHPNSRPLNLLADGNGAGIVVFDELDLLA